MNGTQTQTIAFDVYGTLIDPHGMISMLQHHVGRNAAACSQLWREKQLEYSFRRALMGNYRDFGVCTAQALDYACLTYGTSLSASSKATLLGAYRKLPIFDDVLEGLTGVKEAGFRLYAFSNGKRDDIVSLLENAKISSFFLDIISVDEVHSFKPDPLVYHHFLGRAQAKAENSCLVSANPFDVTGAVSADMHAIWLQRSPGTLMDPWEITPTLTIKRLNTLAQNLGSGLVF